MRYSTALLAAVMAALQVSASPVDLVGRQDSSEGFPTGSFSLPSGFPTDISLPPFPSGTGFSGPSGGCGFSFPSGSGVSVPFPTGSGLSIPSFPGSIPTNCASGYSFPYSAFSTEVPSDSATPTPSIGLPPSGTGTFYPPSFLTTVTAITPPRR